MRKKIFNALNTAYGVLMSISFFGGLIPVFPFIFAIIVGGQLGESIAVFLHKQYYPWVIIVGSIAIIIGLIAMYVGKLEGLSIKKVSINNPDDEEK